MSGFLALPREVYDWFPGDYDTASLYVYLANKANWDRAKGSLPRQQVILEAGQLVTSYRDLVKQTGISFQRVRQILGRLEFSSKINTQKSKHGTIITINNYKELFLDKRHDEHTEQHTPNTPSTHAQHYQDKKTRRQEDKEHITLLGEAPPAGDLPPTPSVQSLYSPFCQTIASEWAAFARGLMPRIKINHAQWSKVVHQLLTLDGYSEEEVRSVFEFVQADDFWRPNAISLMGLRQKSKNGLTKVQNIMAKMQTTSQGINWDEFVKELK